MTSRTSSPDKPLFYAFCALLVWLPLPMASELPFAWSIMVIWVNLIFLIWCWLFLKNKLEITQSCRAAWFVLFLFGLWLLYIVFQLIPLPISILERLSPRSLEHWSSVQYLRGEAELLKVSISVDPKITKVGLLLSTSYVLIFFLTLTLISNRQRLKTLAYALVCSGLFQAVYGSIMTLSSWEYGFFIQKTKYIGVATGTFFNRNHLAGYLEMTIAIGIGLLIATLSTGSNAATIKKKLLNILRLLLSAKARLRLALVMMVIALVLTHSRMGNTAFFLSLFIAGVIGLIFSKHATRSMVILFVSLIVIDILIVGQWFGFEKVKQRLEQTSEMSENRDEVFGYALEQWQDYRLTGSGLGSFYTVFPQYRGVDVNGFNREAHNDYLQFATETGVIGLTLLGLITVISFLAAIVAHARRRDPLMRGISFAAIMGIIAMLIHATVEFNLQMPANAATFIVLLAFAWISANLKTKAGNNL
jgi:putative inorganic carbon (HCO3(-)) transporter